MLVISEMRNRSRSDRSLADHIADRCVVIHSNFELFLRSRIRRQSSFVEGRFLRTGMPCWVRTAKRKSVRPDRDSGEATDVMNFTYEDFLATFVLPLYMANRKRSRISRFNDPKPILSSI